MTNLISQAYDPEKFRQQGHQLVDKLANYLADMQHISPSEKVLDYVTPEAMYSHWQQDLNGSLDDGEKDFFEEIIQSTIHMHHPKYMGHQISNVAPLSALAELLGATLDPGMGVYEQGNAAVVLERVLSKKLGAMIGWDDNCDGFLTSGGTLGNLTALLCARQLLVEVDVWENGYGRKQYAFMVSSEAHYSVERAIKVMGLGSKGVVTVPVDSHFRMRPDKLEACFNKAKEDGVEVIGVVTSSCATATGSYDPIGPVADFCEAKKLWLHVDGAHGACVLFSKKHKHLLAGIERADSVIMDFHKMLMTPALVTSVLFKNGEHSYQTFAQKASYLWDKQESREWYNLAKRTFELTKSCMSIRVYALWRTYGEAFFAENVDRLYGLAMTFTNILLEQPDFEVAVKKPESNIVCFRLMMENWSEEKIEIVNSNIRERVVRDGEFFIVQTKVQGRLFLRTAFMNPFTTTNEMELLIKKIRLVANMP